MKCVVCTLFEHHYHFGLAALVNSLAERCFQGDIYAGFRGPVPPWAQPLKTLANGLIEFHVTPQVRVLFMPLKTEAHLTNYKPDFMLQVEALAGAESDAILYVDPDLVFNMNFDFVEDWLTCGVAVCEDINSPVARDNPMRVGWRRFYHDFGHELTYRSDCYANGGLVGVTWKHRRFLLVWQEFMREMAKLLGGTNIVTIGGGERKKGRYGFADCFLKTDQDGLNAAIEATPEIPVSFLGRDAMGFTSRQPSIPHALGVPKPWKAQYLRMAFNGKSPSKIDKLYWYYADRYVKPFPPAHMKSVRRAIAISSAVGRFWRRLS
jgi:hypothetical protein